MLENNLRKRTRENNTKNWFFFFPPPLFSSPNFLRRKTQTLQRSSRVFGGEPSRAVLRASTGLYLHGEETSFKLGKWLNFESKSEFDHYCLSRLSIFLDLCSILVIMASALSASTNSPVPAIFVTLPWSFRARIFLPGKQLGKRFPEKVMTRLWSLRATKKFYGPSLDGPMGGWLTQLPWIFPTQQWYH